MKAAKIITTIVGTVAAGTVTLSATGQDIANTLHNFNSAWSGGGPTGEICKPCHTPHNAPDLGLTAPSYLWAHTLSTATYTMYDGTQSSADGGITQLDQTTRMCLSCHDGTVALADFHNGDPTTYPGTIEQAPYDGSKSVGIDLTDDHPIGTIAPIPIAGNTGFRAPDNTYDGYGYGDNGRGGYQVPLYTYGGAEIVGCGSCHNPHGETSVPYLLRKSNVGSDLCLTCHLK